MCFGRYYPLTLRQQISSLQHIGFIMAMLLFGSNGGTIAYTTHRIPCNNILAFKRELQAGINCTTSWHVNSMGSIHVKLEYVGVVTTLTLG